MLPVRWLFLPRCLSRFQTARTFAERNSARNITYLLSRVCGTDETLGGKPRLSLAANIYTISISAAFGMLLMRDPAQILPGMQLAYHGVLPLPSLCGFLGATRTRFVAAASPHLRLPTMRRQRRRKRKSRHRCGHPLLRLPRHVPIVLSSSHFTPASSSRPLPVTCSTKTSLLFSEQRYSAPFCARPAAPTPAQPHTILPTPRRGISLGDAYALDAGRGGRQAKSAAPGVGGRRMRSGLQRRICLCVSAQHVAPALAAAGGL